MNTERLSYQGRRAELKQQEKALRLKIDDLRKSIRLTLSPIQEEHLLDAERVAVLGVELGVQHGLLVANLAEQAKIDELLGS